MQKLFIFSKKIITALDLFLDPIIGLFLVGMMALVFRQTINPVLILAGCFFPLVPDLDFLVEIFLHGNVGGKQRREHRTWLHWPLLYVIPTVMLALWQPTYALLFGLSIAWHFFHDSFGLGWGIPLAGPFSWRSYKLKHEGQWFVSWSRPELQEVMCENGDPLWLQKYLALNRKNIFALIVFAVLFFLLVILTILR